MKHSRLFKTIVAMMLIFTMALPAGTAFARTVTPDANYRFYYVGNAHIDTAWKWPYQHTAEVVLRDTWNNQVAALKGSPNRRFTMSAATHYLWLKEYYDTDSNSNPVHANFYNDTISLIAAGQWGLAGGQFVEPDLNLTGGEAFARQGLYAQHIFLEMTGKTATVAYVPDVFGFSGQFPQFIRKTGMQSFVATKLNWRTDPNNGALDPGPWSESSTGRGSTGRESDLFWWEGVDGCDVLAYNCKKDYTDGYATSDFQGSGADTVFNRLTRSGSTSGGTDYPGTFYYDYDSHIRYALGMFGDGDHGGGPYVGNGAGGHDWAPSGNASVRMATIGDYFDDVRTVGASDNGADADKVLSLVYRHKGENYLAYHRGTYTSWSRVKKYNRQNEILAETAEKAATLSYWLDAIPNNGSDKVYQAWYRICTNQMHDVLPGSGSPPLYYQTFMHQELVKNLMNSLQTNALLAMAYRADTTVDDGVPVFVYNPSSWKRDGETTTTVTLDRYYDHIRVFDADDNEIPVTVIEKKANGTAKISFIAKAVPSLGYKVFKVAGSSAPSGFATDLYTSTSGNIITIGNSKLKFTIDRATGNMPSLQDAAGREYFYQTSNLQGNQLQFKSDTGGGSFPAWDMASSEFMSVGTSFTNVNTLNPALPVQVVVNTPEKITVRVSHSITDSANTTPSIATRYITLLAGSDRIDVKFELDWRMYQRNLKLAFPVNVDACAVSAEIAYGAMDAASEVARRRTGNPTSNSTNPLMSNSNTGVPAYAGALGRSTLRYTTWDQARFEQSAHKWFDVTGDNLEYGLSIINDAKYGYDVLRMTRTGGTGNGTDSNISGSETYVRMRQTIVRSPISANEEAETDRYKPVNQVIDTGYQEFNYAIYPHAGDWKTAETSQRAHEVCYPMTSFQAAAAPGDGILGKEKSFLASSKPNVKIGAVKNAHDDQGDKNTMIVRVWESNGIDTTGVVLTLPSKVTLAKEVNMLEHEYNALDNRDAAYGKEIVARTVGNGLTISGNEITFDIGHYEILTFEVKLDAYDGVKVPLIQEQVDISSEFNLRATSPDSSRTSGNIDGQGNSIPELLWRDAKNARVDYQGIKFDLGPADANNMITANGQTISVNLAGKNKVFLLGAGAGINREGKFIVNYTQGEPTEAQIEFADWKSPLTGWVPMDQADTKPYVYDSVAQVFTHWHDGAIDMMTLDNYLYAYYIDVDATRTISSIKLPVASGLKLAAITLINSPIAEYGHTNENYVECDDELYWNFSELNPGAAIGGDTVESQNITGSPEPTGRMDFITVTSSAGGNNAAEMPASMLTDDPETKWCRNQLASGNANFTFDAGESLKVPGYLLRGSYDDMGYSGRVLHTWTVDGSTSASGPWTRISEPGSQGPGWTENSQFRMFMFNQAAIPETGFRYYRLTITRVGVSAAGTALSSIGLLSSTVQLGYVGLVTAYQENGDLAAQAVSGVNKTASAITIDTVNGTNLVKLHGTIASSAAAPVAARYYKTIRKNLNIRVFDDTKLSYMFKPADEVSAHMSIDLKFTDGSRLKYMNAVDINGIRLLPKDQGEGTFIKAGEWNYVQATLGSVAKGKVITEIIYAFEVDDGLPGQYVEGLLDNITIFRDGWDLGDVQVYSALYNANGLMVGFSTSDPIPARAYGAVILNPAIAIDATAAGAGWYVKTFIWTADNFVPVTSAIRY